MARPAQRWRVWFSAAHISGLLGSLFTSFVDLWSGSLADFSKDSMWVTREFQVSLKFVSPLRSPRLHSPMPGPRCDLLRGAGVMALQLLLEMPELALRDEAIPAPREQTSHENLK